MLQPQLTRLPYEVIEMIAEACVVTYGSDVMRGYGVYQLCFLGRLSRTCRQLAQDCAGSLYKTVVITDCKRAMKFLQALQNRPSLRAKVRTCTFRMEIMRDMDQTVNQLSEDLQQTFASETVDRSMIMEARSTSDRRQLENTLIVLILQRLPCLRQLSTNWAALSLATRWPEESRFVGKMLSVLTIFFKDFGGSGPGCDGLWFDWVSAFRPGHLPSEDLLLTLEAADFECQCLLHDSECSYLHQEPTTHVRETLASLRRLSLTHCTDSMIATWLPLTQCPNIEQLILGTTIEFPLEWMLQPFAALSHLKTTLKELRIHWTNTMDPREVNINVLRPLSDFKKLTTLEMPIARVSPHDTTISKSWPPALKSLFLRWNDVSTADFLWAIIHAMQTKCFPDTMESISIDWQVAFRYWVPTHRYDKAILLMLLNTVDSVDALDLACRACHVALRHQVPRHDGTLTAISLAELKDRLIGPWVAHRWQRQFSGLPSTLRQQTKALLRGPNSN